MGHKVDYKITVESDIPYLHATAMTLEQVGKRLIGLNFNAYISYPEIHVSSSIMDDDDLAGLSMEFPELIITSKWSGEDGDEGITYFLAGKSQVGEVVKNYTPFDKEKLQ